jgi:hypothetical protein
LEAAAVNMPAWQDVTLSRVQHVMAQKAPIRYASRVITILTASKVQIQKLMTPDLCPVIMGAGMMILVRHAICAIQIPMRGQVVLEDKNFAVIAINTDNRAN